MTRTPCECPLAGWCERHGMEKRRRQHQLCQANLRYWNQWERGEGGAVTRRTHGNSQNVTVQERRQASERRSRSRRYECVHRSEEKIRDVLCQECSRRMSRKPVFGCELHGECVRQPYRLAEDEEPVRDCKHCPDRADPQV